VEQDEGAMVEIDVEVVSLEIGWMEASNLVMGYYTEGIRSIWLKWLIIRLGRVLRCIRPRRRCGPWRMRKITPRTEGLILIGIVVRVGCPLHALLVWSRCLRPPLINITELFSLTFSPLVYNLQSRQIRELICGMYFLTYRENLYNIQWTFISGVSFSAFMEKYS